MPGPKDAGAPGNSLFNLFIRDAFGERDFKMKKIICLMAACLGLMIILPACVTAPPETGPDALMHKLGFRQFQGEWTAPEELNGFRLDEKGVPADFHSQPAPIGLCMTVALKYGASEADIDKIKKGFHRFSELIWRNTFGNMHIKKVVLINNNAGPGYITLARLKKEEGGHAWFGGVITVGVNLLDIGGDKNPDIGLRVFGAGILHEFNHSMFRLPDEYPYQGQPDKPVKQCVMDPRSRQTGLCAECEAIILKKFTGFRFPPESERAGWSESRPVPEIYFMVK